MSDQKRRSQADKAREKAARSGWSVSYRGVTLGPSLVSINGVFVGVVNRVRAENIPHGPIAAVLLDGPEEAST